MDLFMAHLSMADLSGVDLTEANLSLADLSWSDLSEANLFKANLDNANLFRADLSWSDLSEADLSRADLSGADLSGAYLIDVNLSRANLSRADLSGADLSGADVSRANLSGADLFMANLRGADLSRANLRGADLSDANLREANLCEANLSKAKLSGAELINANLVETDLKNADFTGCRIYGVSAWNLRTNKKTKQTGLIITQYNEPTVTVDDLEVAQFIYLVLNRKKIRKVIDSITSKAVLILGRFTPERKTVLDVIANELRKNNLLPIIFDFDRVTSRDFTETIKTLAGMSLFVIADITNPKSAPLELQATIPDYQIPFVPIIEEGEQPFSMFRDLPKYPWVLRLLQYSSLVTLRKGFKKAIIDEAFRMHKKIRIEKATELKPRSLKDYLGGK